MSLSASSCVQWLHVLIKPKSHGPFHGLLLQQNRGKGMIQYKREHSMFISTPINTA